MYSNVHFSSRKHVLGKCISLISFLFVSHSLLYVILMLYVSSELFSCNVLLCLFNVIISLYIVYWMCIVYCSLLYLCVCYWFLLLVSCASVEGRGLFRQQRLFPLSPSRISCWKIIILIKKLMYHIYPNLKRSQVFLERIMSRYFCVFVYSLSLRSVSLLCYQISLLSVASSVLEMQHCLMPWRTCYEEQCCQGKEKRRWAQDTGVHSTED